MVPHAGLYVVGEHINSGIGRDTIIPSYIPSRMQCQQHYNSVKDEFPLSRLLEIYQICKSDKVKTPLLAMSPNSERRT